MQLLLDEKCVHWSQCAIHYSIKIQASNVRKFPPGDTNSDQCWNHISFGTFHCNSVIVSYYSFSDCETWFFLCEYTKSTFKPCARYFKSYSALNKTAASLCSSGKREWKIEAFLYSLSDRCPWFWGVQTHLITSEGNGPGLRWPNGICRPGSFLPSTPWLLYFTDGDTRKASKVNACVTSFCVCVGSVKVAHVGDGRKPRRMSIKG